MMGRHITKQWTFLGYFFTGLWVWIAVIFLSGALTSRFQVLTPLAALFLTFLAVAIILPLITYVRLRRRTKALQAYAQAHGLSLEPDIAVSVRVDSLGAIGEIHGARDQRAFNGVAGDDWQYCDFKYHLYGQTKYGEYRRATVYYAVMSTKLPRRLPNVFFDSIKARRRQFRFHFAAKQRHSLEGDFDKFFVTYFPPQYTIDSMSFISPEVMWAMREAADYDIEIYGDRLFLYGPLDKPDQQLPDMSAKIVHIKKMLMHNILTYRDERLPFEEGRKGVASIGVSLNRSRFWGMTAIVVVICYVLYFAWQTAGYPFP